MKKNKHVRFTERQELLLRLLTAKYNQPHAVYPKLNKRGYKRFNTRVKINTMIFRMKTIEY